MANKNGLCGGVPVYFDGSAPIWAAKDSPQFTGNATFEEITVLDSESGDNVVISPSAIILSNTVSTDDATINITDAGLMNIYGPQGDGMLIFPQGAGLGSIQMQATATKVVMQSGDNGDQLVCSSIKGYNAITGTGTSGVGMDSAESGVVNFVTVTTAGSLTIQFNGSNCIPGTIWEFVLNPASFAGATVTFNNLSTVLATFTPSTATAGKAFQVRVFTPDGTTFYVLE